IVNPRHLEPVLREAVCQQCHLQGEVRVVRRGRSLFDYRPGLPLHLFESAFTRLPENASGQKSVGHVEQIALSRCFQESKGRFGCISCHDPHELPAPEKKIAFYRGRCLQCHQEQESRVRGQESGVKSQESGVRSQETERERSAQRASPCSVPLSVRREKSKEDS